MCIVCGRDLIESCFVFWDSAYCSYYCQRFYELKLTKYKPSKNTHTKTGHLVIVHDDCKQPLFYPERDTQPYRNPNDPRVKTQIAKGKTGTHAYEVSKYESRKSIAGV